MIGRLCGELIVKQAPHLMLDVAGVGYEVEAPMSTIYELPDPGEQVVLLTHLVVRDDAHILYGFISAEERGMFRTLIKVNGVGPRMGLAILSSMNPAEFSHCVAHGDAVALTRIPGVGKKTAERLIVEMKDKLDKTLLDSGAGVAANLRSNHAKDAQTEAIQALIALGYKPREAESMAKSVAVEGMSSEAIIRQSLQSKS